MTERLCTNEASARAKGRLPEGAWETRDVKNMLPGILQQAARLLCSLRPMLAGSRCTRRTRWRFCIGVIPAKHASIVHQDRYNRKIII